VNSKYIDSLFPSNLEPTLQFIAFFTILTFIPLIVLTMTPFLRITIVLSLLRKSVGMDQGVPSLVLTGLGMILTCFIMSNSIEEINKKAIAPLYKKEISLGQAIVNGYEPVRKRMLTQIDERDIKFFYDLRDKPIPPSPDKIGFAELVCAHLMGELRIAFSIGFIISLPFLVIDLILANILLALGMTSLSPSVISLPFKLMIFVAVDGWNLAIKGLVESFK